MIAFSASEMKVLSVESRRSKEEILGANITILNTEMVKAAKRGFTHTRIKYGLLNITNYEYDSGVDEKTLREYLEDKGFSVDFSFSPPGSRNKEDYSIEIDWKVKKD